jgi:hypothetical protein
MKRAIFFVQLLLIGSILLSQNLVTNPGFEAWDRTDKPTGWTNTQGCLAESVLVMSGNYSCRQEGTTTSRDLGQKVIVKPSTQYRFSFLYKSDQGTTGNGCRVWCSWLDNTQAGIDEPVLHSGFLKSDTWLKYEEAVTSPEGAGYFYLLVRTLPNSITYWDDFIFEEDLVSYDIETIVPEIKIYPNPARNYVTISNIQNLQHIDIQSLTGIIVWEGDFHGEDQATIPVAGIANGIYFIKIKSAGRYSIRKFIIKSNP